MRQAIATKTRLEQQIDTISFDNPYYERKILDLQRRYDIIGDTEAYMEQLKQQIQDICQEQISSENVYELLRAFDDLYAVLEPKEKRDLMRAIVERVDLFPKQREDGCWVRNIVFNLTYPKADRVKKCDS